MIDDPNKDPLLSEAERWISDYDNQEGGALYDWNEETIKQFKDIPIETLLNDPYFLGLEGKMFDSVYADVCDLWNDRKNREVNLAIFLEAIGAGKSFKSSIILWLLWYEMCMHKNPQQAYGLADNSVICIMLLSRSEVQSRRVVFTYCWERFQSGFYNVYSAVIDEANFLEVTEDSKKSNEEMYDAGEEMYNAVMNRMTSRFMRHGSIPGVIVLISSPRYPDSFLERKIKEGKSVGIEKLNMFVRSRSLWEAKGPKYFDMSKYFVIDTDSLEIIKEVK